MEQFYIMLTDATCYETAMLYPNNIKLLWESVDWCYGQMKRTRKFLKIHTSRTKYLKQRERQAIIAVTQGIKIITKVLTNSRRFLKQGRVSGTG